ncbi:MAG: SphA family protein, partial [Rhodoferax sp.]
IYPVSLVAASANATVQAGLAAQNASNNMAVSGFGDTELSVVWVRHQDRMKIAAGASLFVPTGAYDKTRGPNPGFGNFYTLRPGVAITYALSPEHGPNAWDSGVTLAARLSYGINTTNLDTDYRSGNFVYAEAAVVKVSGDWSVGANVLGIQQTSDDSGSGVTQPGLRYRNYAFGPFLSYKLPGKDAGFNLHFSRNFGSQNALVSESLQLRLIKAW